MSGDLLGSPKPKEMTAGGLANQRRQRPNAGKAEAASAGEAVAPGGRLPGGGGSAGQSQWRWRRQQRSALGSRAFTRPYHATSASAS